MFGSFEMPTGFDEEESPKAYIKPSKLPLGDHKFRVVLSPIVGWVEWDTDKKPYRYRDGQQPSISKNPDEPMKKFWALYVWDYAKEDFYVMEIVQKTIRERLVGLYKDESWGPFTGYDIKISRKEVGGRTIYDVNPLPHKPMADKIMEAYKRRPVRLEALFEGKDPWKDLTPSAVKKPGSQLSALSEMLKVDDIPDDLLRDYIQSIADRKGEPFEDVVTYAIQIYPSVKGSYSLFRNKKLSQLAG